MGKKEETRAAESILTAKCRKKRNYGCTEVTIGFAYSGYGGNGREIVDFMEMDSKGTFRCYEIKVTMQDLKSKAAKSWYGHYNYLVAGGELIGNIDSWIGTIPPPCRRIYCKR